MFPTGRPGAALLLLRAALSLMLLEGVLSRPAVPGSSWLNALLWSIAILIFLGLYTPVAAVLCVLIELAVWQGFGGSLEVVHVCAMINAVALALLGPGGYSVDALFYGRRQVHFPTVDDEM